MPEYLAPGVYIEEVPFGSHPIEGVFTSTTGFLAVSSGKSVLGPLTSFTDFQRAAGSSPSVNLPLAVRGYFENGGRRCFVSQIAAADPLEEALAALDAHAISLLCCPDEAAIPNAQAVMVAHCERRKDRMCILSSPLPVLPVATHPLPVHSSYAAYYFPWLVVNALDGTSAMTIPPCGHIAGVYARTDTQAGVWKAPADASLAGVTALTQSLTSAESDQLNALGIDVIRTFAASGIRVWGARTTSSDPDYKYVNIRRLLIYIEKSIDLGVQWAVFEPNGPAMWNTVRAAVENFLIGIWRSGGLQGSKVDEAFFVRCDESTMTQTDIHHGRLGLLVGVAPTRPAEFVLLRITIQTEAVSPPLTGK